MLKLVAAVGLVAAGYYVGKNNNTVKAKVNDVYNQVVDGSVSFGEDLMVRGKSFLEYIRDEVSEQLSKVKSQVDHHTV